jgi:hypothetical protein
MDILHLVDRLEELFNDSRPIPLTHNVVVDEDRFLEIIDQMRISIPDEVKSAQQMIAQRDRVLAQAQEEANRTISLAKDRGDELTHRDSIVEAAQARAEQIITQSKIEADEIRLEADEYVIGALSSVEAELITVLNQTRNGITKLKADHQVLEQPLEESEPLG